MFFAARTWAGCTLGAALCIAQASAARADGLPQGRAAVPAEWGYFFSGYDFADGSIRSYQGIVVSLGGDMRRDGLVVRASGARVDYDITPGDGRGYQADLMLGYAFNHSGMRGGIYAGADYQDFRLKPDNPAENLRGTEIGFKIAADVETKRTAPYYASVSGAYSTAFDTYWARTRIGMNMPRLTFGPEAVFLGNVNYGAVRLGAFAGFKISVLPGMETQVTVSGGYQAASEGAGAANSATAGGEGGYATISFRTAF
jgi:hypothetical protein